MNFYQALPQKCINLKKTMCFLSIIFTLLLQNNLGFWPSGSCSNQTLDVTTGTVHRIFNLTCDTLADLPEKNLYLRQYHPHFLIGYEVTYECMAGYQLPNLVIILYILMILEQ